MDQLGNRLIPSFSIGLSGLYSRSSGFVQMTECSSATSTRRSELDELKVYGMNSLSTLARIANEVLAGELAAKRKQYDQAVAHLRKAIEEEDSLVYTEPPDWPNPARQNLGAILLAAGRPAEAEKVYREDLVRHRDNGWSLLGLAQSLEAQGNPSESSEAHERFAKAWARADVEIVASRY